MAIPYVFAEVTFTIDGTDFSCPVTSAAFKSTPKPLLVNTLCGPKSAAGRSTYTLDLEGVQDYFEGVDSLCGYLEDHEGEKAEVVVDWTASDGGGEVTKTGTVTLVAPDFGGVADELGTFSISLPCDGKPARVTLASS